MPPEMIIPTLQAMKMWVAENTASGKLVDSWAFAGTIGGGGILDVDSHEELDAVMTKFPFAPVSNVELYPITDLAASLDRGEANVAEMMAAMQAGG